VNDGAGARNEVPYRRIGWTVLRVLASAVIVGTAYYLLPFDRAATWEVITLLAVGLLALVVLIGFQVRAIVRSPFPNLRAIEALATSLPLFLLLFAGAYYVMARLAPGSFGSHLTRTDAMYFTVTVFTTVGFGDISAKTETARLVVTGQMIADVLVLGLESGSSSAPSDAASSAAGGGRTPAHSRARYRGVPSRSPSAPRHGARRPRACGRSP
jgi:voltage-gated potassium channel